MMTIPAKIVLAQPTSSKQPSIIYVNSKKGGGEGETLFNFNITLNIFGPPLIGLKLGNDILVEPYCGDSQLERNLYLF